VESLLRYVWFNPPLEVEIYEQGASVIHTIFARSFPSRIEKLVSKVESTELNKEMWLLLFLS
jgi:hypothetical protein